MSSARDVHGGASLPLLVDKLDLLLERLCEKGTITVESLTPLEAGRRPAAKLAAKLAMRVEEGARDRQPSRRRWRPEPSRVALSRTHSR